MEAIREITEWNGNTPNHTYLVDGTKLAAYIAAGSKEPFYFKDPLNFDRRGRKFLTLKANPFKLEKKETRIKVIGSKGNVYWVDPEAQTCTCPGFTYRGTCKHLSELN